MTTTPIALAGIGKIAQDAHLPALDGSEDWHLAATISRNAGVDGVPGYQDIDAFLADRRGIDTISLALPPGPRFDYAVKALRAGMNVMLEKPPATTLGACRHLVREAEAAGVSLFMSWHSRMGRACDAAAKKIRGRKLKKLRVVWTEDVRQFHPDQDWVWEAGNLGVFDPGINAFSILVKILDKPIHLSKAHLIVPEGRDTPITSDLEFFHPDGAEIGMRLDWNHEGAPVWDMEIETDEGRFDLVRSGSAIDTGAGEECPSGADEYPLLYARMAELVQAGESDCDTRPLEMAADAFLIGTREVGPRFDW